MTTKEERKITLFLSKQQYDVKTETWHNWNSVFSLLLDLSGQNSFTFISDGIEKGKSL